MSILYAKLSKKKKLNSKESFSLQPFLCQEFSFQWFFFFAKNSLPNDHYNLYNWEYGREQQSQMTHMYYNFFSFEELSLNHVDPLVLGARIGERTKCSNFAVICFHASTKYFKNMPKQFGLSLTKGTYS